MEGADFAQLVEHYIDERVTLREFASEHTTRQVRSILLRFVDGAEQLDRDHVLDWYARYRRHAPGTMRTMHGVVRTFTRWAVDHGHLRVDPMAGMSTPKVPRAVPRALTAGELRQLWDVLPDARARAIVALMAGLGLRVAEVSALQVGDWDRYSEVLVVRHGKGGHDRSLPVPTNVSRVLDAYLVARPARAGALIRSQRDDTAICSDHISRLMSEWMRAAGVKHAAFDGKACHALRHTFAQLLYERGQDHDLRLVQAALGHQHLASTEIYMRRHVDAVRLRAAMELSSLTATA